LERSRLRAFSSSFQSFAASKRKAASFLLVVFVHTRFVDAVLRGIFHKFLPLTFVSYQGKIVAGDHARNPTDSDTVVCGAGLH